MERKCACHYAPRRVRSRPGGITRNVGESVLLGVVQGKGQWLRGDEGVGVTDGWRECMNLDSEEKKNAGHRGGDVVGGEC